MQQNFGPSADLHGMISTMVLVLIWLINVALLEV